MEDSQQKKPVLRPPSRKVIALAAVAVLGAGLLMIFLLPWHGTFEVSCAVAECDSGQPIEGAKVTAFFFRDSSPGTNDFFRVLGSLFGGVHRCTAVTGKDGIAVFRVSDRWKGSTRVPVFLATAEGYRDPTKPHGCDVSGIKAPTVVFLEKLDGP